LAALFLPFKPRGNRPIYQARQSIFSDNLASRWIKAADKLPAQYAQPFANHSTDRANTSNESKIVLAHIPVSGVKGSADHE
jgi:hypothetical protein